MKKYHVTVDGHIYEVTVEEVSGTSAKVVAAPPKPAAPTPPPPPSKPVSAVPKPAPAPAASVSGGTQIQAPMPGKILTVHVKPGDSVKSGKVLLILEAMKMENDIMAPVDGVIQAVNVNAGESVNTGDVLVVMG